QGMSYPFTFLTKNVRIIILPLISIGILLLSPSLRAQTTPVYLDPSYSIGVRVNNLISKMTLEEKVSQMQNSTSAIPRLKIHAYDWWNESLHGVARSGVATVFPQ